MPAKTCHAAVLICFELYRATGPQAEHVVSSQAVLGAADVL